jgi:hypothetical protein
MKEKLGFYLANIFPSTILKSIECIEKIELDLYASLNISYELKIESILKFTLEVLNQLTSFKSKGFVDIDDFNKNKILKIVLSLNKKLFLSKLREKQLAIVLNVLYLILLKNIYLLNYLKNEKLVEINDLELLSDL